MRVLMFGTPEFAVPTLNALIAAHDVVAVITRPDKPSGRGHRVTASPVKLVADAHGIPVLQPTRLDDPQWISDLVAVTPDIAVVAAYGRLLPQSLLEVPRLGFINVHASLLPRWRGAAPIHRAVMAGDLVTGVTIMRVVLALDAGPILAARSTPIADTDTSADLDRRLALLGADLLSATLGQLDVPGLLEVPQEESNVTYAPRLERRESEIDWTRPAVDIDRQVRGLQPWPLAAIRLEGRRVAFLRSVVVEAPAGAAPGTVLEADASGLTIACGSGALRVIELVPEGRRPMPAAAFLNGNPVAPGTRVMPLAAADQQS